MFRFSSLAVHCGCYRFVCFHFASSFLAGSLVSVTSFRVPTAFIFSSCLLGFPGGMFLVDLCTHATRYGLIAGLFQTFHVALSKLAFVAGY